MNQRQPPLWKRINGFNEQTAILVSIITGSMFFFWTFALIIACIRLAGSPESNNILTAAENDIQVLLISSSAVTGALTLATLLKVLKSICKKENQICAELGGKEVISGRNHAKSNSGPA